MENRHLPYQNLDSLVKRFSEAFNRFYNEEIAKGRNVTELSALKKLIDKNIKNPYLEYVLSVGLNEKLLMNDPPSERDEFSELQDLPKELKSISESKELTSADFQGLEKYFDFDIFSKIKKLQKALVGLQDLFELLANVDKQPIKINGEKLNVDLKQMEMAEVELLINLLTRINKAIAAAKHDNTFSQTFSEVDNLKKMVKDLPTLELYTSQKEVRKLPRHSRKSSEVDNLKQLVKDLPTLKLNTSQKEVRKLPRHSRKSSEVDDLRQMVKNLPDNLTNLSQKVHNTPTTNVQIKSITETSEILKRKKMKKPRSTDGINVTIQKRSSSGNKKEILIQSSTQNDLRNLPADKTEKKRKSKHTRLSSAPSRKVVQWKNKTPEGQVVILTPVKLVENPLLQSQLSQNEHGLFASFKRNPGHKRSISSPGRASFMKK